MTTHDKDKIFAAAKEADSGFTGDESFNLGTSLVGLEAIERFYAIAFEAGADSRDAEFAELKDALDYNWGKYKVMVQDKKAEIAELVAALETLAELGILHIHNGQPAWIFPLSVKDRVESAIAKVRKPE